MKALTGKANQKRMQIEAMPETTFDEIVFRLQSLNQQYLWNFGVVVDPDTAKIKSCLPATQISREAGTI